jgi:aspartate-alanine antiporter
MVEIVSYVHSIFLKLPFLALFITIALGYFIGKFHFKGFVLGGITGSLIIGILVGQIGVKIDPEISSFFFALFIYAVGYQGGAQFFRSINRKTFIQLISATITCVLGLECVLVFAWLFDLDKGTAAGLGAGGLTQSAMIGTASDAIAKLNISQASINAMQANIAVGYAICYIFGSFGPIILLCTIIPWIMKWDIRNSAIKLAKDGHASDDNLEEGQFEAIHSIDTRVYKVKENSPAISKSIEYYLEQHIAIEAIVRNNQMVNVDATTIINQDDIIAVTTNVSEFSECYNLFGPEIEKPESMKLTEEVRKIIVNSKKFDKKSIKEFYTIVGNKVAGGIFFNTISRLGEVLKAKPNLQLKKGDEIAIIGKTADLNVASKLLGYTISATKITDFIFFGLGMSIGFIFGLYSFTVFGISIMLGNGVGCLLAGLILGWVRSTHKRYASLPTGASNFLRDFGLAVFVAAVGITAGPEATMAIKKYGAKLFLLGIGVTIIPQVISFIISYYVLKIKNPIDILATIAGGRSANPGFAALLDKAGNSTPVLPFTASYAIANIWLTLWGPIIVALVAKIHP